ncbi:unnamed protein product [Amoebophrya sp. A120]|nr:unnamed protein product [Amoebophrya sp. A120]|eukprot:GSA120T00021869001.1
MVENFLQNYKSTGLHDPLKLTIQDFLQRNENQKPLDEQFQVSKKIWKKISTELLSNSRKDFDNDWTPDLQIGKESKKEREKRVSKASFSCFTSFGTRSSDVSSHAFSSRSGAAGATSSPSFADSLLVSAMRNSRPPPTADALFSAMTTTAAVAVNNKQSSSSTVVTVEPFLQIVQAFLEVWGERLLCEKLSDVAQRLYDEYFGVEEDTGFEETDEQGFT